MKCKCCLNYVPCILKDLVCIYAAFAKEIVFNSSNKRHQMLSHSLPNPFEFHCVAVQKGELLDKQLWHGGYHTQLSRHSWETDLLSCEGRRGRGRGGVSCRVAAVNSQGKHNWHCVPTITAVVRLSESQCVCLCVWERVCQRFASSGKKKKRWRQRRVSQGRRRNSSGLPEEKSSSDSLTVLSLISL